MNTTDHAPVPHKSFSRRAQPRVEVVGQLRGQAITYRTPLVIRDISAGGFSVESPIPFRVGSEHPFRFTAVGGEVVFISALTVHNRPVETSTSAPQASFVAGFRFVHTGPETAQAIETLLGAVTATLEFPGTSELGPPEL